MANFKVRWEIDIEAEDALVAAKTALMIQRDSESWAQVFEVTTEGGMIITYDLAPIED